MVEELSLASFGFAKLVVSFDFEPEVPGRPRLGDLGVTSLVLRVSGWRSELVGARTAKLTLEGFGLIVEDVLEYTSDDTKGSSAVLSTSPRLGSTKLGDGSMLMLCTFVLILPLFLLSMLAFENHPGFLLDASCLRIASRFSGSLAERIASAARASWAVRSASARSCAW